MIHNLLYISNGLIISGYVGYFLLVIINQKRKLNNNSGFDITKAMLNEYNSINIILGNSFFTVYNIKRKVIKIANKCYYGNSISDISIPLIEAGISVDDDGKNKFLNGLKKIISNLKLLYVLPLVAILLNINTYGTTDAKIGILTLIVFSFISYMIINIKNDCYNWVTKRIKQIKTIKEEDMEKITDFINKVILLDKFIFIGELVMIIKFVAVLLDFN